jgi:DNA polymerase/3'-5' exonuclease PolX
MSNQSIVHPFDIISKEFGILIDNALCLKPTGWSFKLKTYRKVLDILGTSQREGDWTCPDILKLLRGGGMKFIGDTGNPPFKSQVLDKIDKILREGSLGIEVDPKANVIKQLIQIPEVGPRKADKLYEKGISSIDDLRDRPHLLNRKQQIGLRHLEDLTKRIPRSEMEEWRELLMGMIGEEVGDKSGLDMELAGSYRRGALDSGDIDFYVSLPVIRKGLMKSLVDRLVLGGYLERDDMISCGEHKMMSVVRLGGERVSRHLDVFIYPKKEYAFALLFATGSGGFNIKMRNYAKKKGYSLSDKGLRLDSTKGDWISKEEIEEKLGKPYIESERDIFEFLGLDWVEPSSRSEMVKW